MKTTHRLRASGLSWFLAGFILTGVVAFARYEPTPACAIMLDQMNIFYIGADNPVTVLVTGVPQEEIQLSASGSGGVTLEKKDDMHYNVRATTPGEARITVAWKDEVSQTFQYRVKRIPDPEARLGGTYKSGHIPNGTFRVQKGLSIVLENFDFDLTCNLIDFEVVRAPRKGDPIVLKNAGVRFSQEVQQLIQLARPGDRYYFNSIKTKCPGDMANREIGSLEFVIE